MQTLSQRAWTENLAPPCNHAVAFGKFSPHCALVSSLQMERERELQEFNESLHLKSLEPIT